MRNEALTDQNCGLECQSCRMPLSFSQAQACKEGETNARKA